jgi:hypothetical protein
MDITRTKQGFQALRQAIADQEERTSIQILLSINQAFADQEFRQKKSLFDEVRSMLDMPQFEEERNRYTMRDNNTKFNLYLDQARRAVASILQNDAISALDDEMDYAMDDDAMDDANMVDQSDTRFNERRAQNYQRQAEAELKKKLRDMDYFKTTFNERRQDCGLRISKVLRLDNEGRAIYIDGIVADKKLKKGTKIEMQLYKKNVQNEDPDAPVTLGDQFFNYDTLSDFQLTYGFASGIDGFELLPTIPTGCGIAMFSNEPPLEKRVFQNEEGVLVSTPNKPNAKVFGDVIPTGDEEGEVIFYIQLTRDVKRDEEIVWDYGSMYRRNYRDYWGNRLTLGDKVSAFYVFDGKRYEARILEKINKDTYKVKWKDGTISEVSVELIDKIN